MTSFIVELWDSIFTPGTSPALIKATHMSFITLISIFITLVYISESKFRFHFINLLLISIAFYGVVIWFIREISHADAEDRKKHE